MKILNNSHKLNNFIRENKEKKIVFTNGVFDLLHSGHIDLIRFARNQGDILVIGINDDESVKRLKGSKRPIYPLSERMEILSEIEFVNYIIPFAEDTPLKLIKSIHRIDILVKGDDYKPGKVVGRKEVEEMGGKLVLFKFIASLSTSSIIQSIKKS